MKALLDTNVISETRRADLDPRILGNMVAFGLHDAYISVITLGELIDGVRRLPTGARRNELEAWVNGIQTVYSARILPVDIEIARLWGDLSARCRAIGRPLAAPDGLIAATALRHGLHLMTRNTSDFYGTDVLLINPWDE